MKSCRWALVAVLFIVFVGPSLSLIKCTEDQQTYEFTECDSAESRWRVAVPKDPDVCETREAPVRQKDCTYSCELGHYVDVTSKTLECKACPKGTYSVGGGVRFSSWDKLPTGFESHVTGAHYQGYQYDSEYYKAEESSNCSKVGWLPSGDSISSPGDECTSELSYAVTLQKDGFVSFTYYFTDEIYTVFRVFVRNDQCKVSHLDRDETFIPSSVNSEWLTKKINLKAGRNVIVWQASAITYSDDSGTRDPVYIKDIEIQGVSYTSECTPCDAGFYNNLEGQGSCKMCSVNTFSSGGATECSKCNEVTEYAGRGAKNCTQRKPCTEQDYYEIRTACDSEHKTQVKYQWIEPKICQDDIQGAKELPASGAKEECPPCNPGMHLNGSKCVFCPVNHFSNGTGDCKKCAVSTEPVYGYHFKWWREIPDAIYASCFSMSDRGCTSKRGWQPRGVYLDSGINQAEDVFMRLRIHVNGFGSHEGIVAPKPGQYGEITFTFELICDGDCVFKFKEKPKYKGISEIATWGGNKEKVKYSYLINSKESTEFIWTFQKHSTYSYETNAFHSSSDRVKIYSIIINNTVDGGAEHCRECPVTSSEKGCINCPKGNYIDTQRHKCVPCPKGTYLNTSNPYGRTACIKCGPALTSEEGSTVCHSNCSFSSKKHNRKFDLSALNGAHTVTSAPSFTSRGFRYYHLFNVSLCGQTHRDAFCHSNISLSSGKSEVFNLTSPVCRMTVIPDPHVITTQAMSLGEHLLGVYEDIDDNSTDKRSVFADEGGPVTNTSNFFLFKFHGRSFTQACPNGRSVWVTLLCDSFVEKGELNLPSKCPDGTCDGCRFEMLMRTKYACPVCSELDYTKVESSCVGGNKTTTYVWNEPKLCRDGVKKPDPMVTECSILEQSIGAAMKNFKIGIAVIAALLVLMICTMFGLWYKNRKLTYKYHRLVQNSSDKPGELPAVERCVVDEDEEDDEEVQFRIGQDRGKKILKKIRDMASGGKRKEKVTFDDDEEEYFDSVHLETGKEAHDDDFN
ncbi:endosome/lysosome-associated apoptosis and autophagy regulator family member 2-like isoform X1 [Montipora foliosa]|uniref:endosome/lysosome-associated apoptosis and autophagy regulator family member 2-like isoform X1 n=1 Tax=Montipora foliosa TaxID=591990 RepID=UPI0035F144B3